MWKILKKAVRCVDADATLLNLWDASFIGTILITSNYITWFDSLFFPLISYSLYFPFPSCSLDITRTGEFFVTGSGDKVLKLWSYDEGEKIEGKRESEEKREQKSEIN